MDSTSKRFCVYLHRGRQCKNRPNAHQPLHKTRKRLPWSSTFFEVRASQLEDPAHTIVVIARDRPWAYLIPAFEQGVRFVSVRSNLTAPDRPTRLQSEIRALLQSHQGPIYLLTRREFVREDAETLKAYQLSLKSLDGYSIKSKHEQDGLCLWPVVRRRG